MKKKKVLEFLRSQPVMSIATASGNDPLSSILLFAVDDDMTFYFATGTESNKVKILMRNKNISFSVWEYKKILVQGLGEAIALKSESEINKALEKLAKVAGDMKDFWPPLLNLWHQDYTIFKIKSKSIKALSLKSDKIKDGSAVFENVKF